MKKYASPNVTPELVKTYYNKFMKIKNFTLTPTNIIATTTYLINMISTLSSLTPSAKERLVLDVLKMLADHAYDGDDDEEANETALKLLIEQTVPGMFGVMRDISTGDTIVNIRKKCRGLWC